jgi:hypothetical protein
MGQNNKPNTFLKAFDLQKPRFNLAKVSAQPIFFSVFLSYDFWDPAPQGLLGAHNYAIGVPFMYFGWYLTP